MSLNDLIDTLLELRARIGRPTADLVQAHILLSPYAPLELDDIDEDEEGAIERVEHFGGAVYLMGKK